MDVTNRGVTGPLTRTEEEEPKLNDLIIESLEKNYYGTEFLPQNRVLEFTSRIALEQELSFHLDANSVQQAVDYILNPNAPAKILFLLLCICEKLHFFPDFLQRSYNDYDLPVMRDTVRKKAGRGTICICSVNGPETSDKRREWPMGRGWTGNDKISFISNQWFFMAPVFTADKFDHDLHSHVPLPYMTKNDSNNGGSFSQVYQVEIHEAHQKVISSSSEAGHIKAAVKEMIQGPEWYNQERQTLRIIREITHDNLIKPIAAYNIESKGYFLFPWAEGGNLRNFWNRDNTSAGAVMNKDRQLMAWVLAQMRGLCNAVKTFHGQGGRHGDIKPENILLFSKDKKSLGTLRIADVGLGKVHVEATNRRKELGEVSNTNTGTTRYLCPEFDSCINGQFSRGSDIWSLGCVFLEFIIWAMRGKTGLERFIECEIKQFWQGPGPESKVHEVVDAWMSDLTAALNSGGQTSALGDVLKLVQSHMLKPRDSRMDSAGISRELDKIHERAMRHREYLLEPKLWDRLSKRQMPSFQPSHQNLLVASERTSFQRRPLQQQTSFPNVSAGTGHPGLPKFVLSNSDDPEVLGNEPVPPQQDQLSELHDIWESHADKGFSQNLFRRPGWPVPLPSSSTPHLCERCSALDIWQQGFSITLRKNELMEMSMKCKLCNLFSQALEGLFWMESNAVEVGRVGSTLQVKPGGPAILSIYADTAYSDKVPAFAQTGNPLLPQPGSSEQYTLLKAWINTCNNIHDHETTSAVDGKITTCQLDCHPTRILDVGTTTDPNLRLVSGAQMESSDYLALSHCWGEGEASRFGRTLPENFPRRQKHIDPLELPLNFCQAVQVARGLEVRYLWIDSVCIVQEDEEDWKRESIRMEKVYSNALCVLAATSASSSAEGFLTLARAQRDFATLQSPSGVTSYICKPMDNFQQDVEKAVLNTRGWVLQERALARRTIHFTSNQVYFECGRGVHCETLMRLTNGRSAFLADSNFPTAVEKFYKGGRIVLTQNLYQQYSGLKFNQYKDRPIAIAGLEKRLTTVFNTQGGYGVMEDFLERTLLWKRSDGCPLRPIQFPKERNVPSWSWMAYAGVISYVHVDFGRVDWTKEYKSPFDTGSGSFGKRHWVADGNNSPPILLASKIRKLNPALEGVEFLKRVVFDLDTATDARRIQDLRCVVLGKNKVEESARSSSVTCYAIIVQASSELVGAYVRVGTGVLLDSHILWDSSEEGEVH